VFELQKYLDILYQGVWNNIPSMQADSDMGCWFAKKFLIFRLVQLQIALFTELRRVSGLTIEI